MLIAMWFVLRLNLGQRWSKYKTIRFIRPLLLLADLPGIRMSFFEVGTNLGLRTFCTGAPFAPFGCPGGLKHGAEFWMPTKEDGVGVYLPHI